ncbi:hypothetical protein P0L94_07095 [Microbacter sp. GSS18]|nr:hypothetical protein P0L94_07095 [Microbacter sp. GSS18]
MTDALSAAGSISGAIISGRMTEGQTRWANRRASASLLQGALLPLRRLMAQLSFSGDVSEWKATFTVAIHALQGERSRTPSGWGHLEQSVREAVACAVGLGLADREPAQDCESHFHQDKIWLMFAADYLDYVIPVIGRWGEESSTRRSQNTELIDFGKWLARTGRHEPGKGLWPTT